MRTLVSERSKWLIKNISMSILVSKDQRIISLVLVTVLAFLRSFLVPDSSKLCCQTIFVMYDHIILLQVDLSQVCCSKMFSEPLLDV